MVKQMVTRSQTREAEDIIPRLAAALRETPKHSYRCSEVYNCVERALNCIFQLGKMEHEFSQEQKHLLRPLLANAVSAFGLYAKREVSNLSSTTALWEMDRVCIMRCAFAFLLNKEGQYMTTFDPPGTSQLHASLYWGLVRDVDWMLYDCHFHERNVPWQEWLTPRIMAGGKRW